MTSHWPLEGVNATRRCLRGSATAGGHVDARGHSVCRKRSTCHAHNAQEGHCVSAIINLRCNSTFSNNSLDYIYMCCVMWSRLLRFSGGSVKTNPSWLCVTLWLYLADIELPNLPAVSRLRWLSMNLSCGIICSLCDKCLVGDQTLRSLMKQVVETSLITILTMSLLSFSIFFIISYILLMERDDQQP